MTRFGADLRDVALADPGTAPSGPRPAVVQHDVQLTAWMHLRAVLQERRELLVAVTLECSISDLAEIGDVGRFASARHLVLGNVNTLMNPALLRARAEGARSPNTRGIRATSNELIGTQVRWIRNRIYVSRYLASWSGLTPTVHASDKTIRHGHISKLGPSSLRWVLIEASYAARRNAEFKDAFDRIARRRGNEIATVAIARRLLVRIFHTLKAINR